MTLWGVGRMGSGAVSDKTASSSVLAAQGSAPAPQDVADTFDELLSLRT